jgi:hypothetical protein
MLTSLDLQVGRNEQFGKAGLGSAGLLAGWANTEESHVWNDGVTAVLLIRKYDDIPPLIVAVYGQPYLPKPGWVQDITLYANGWLGGFWRLVIDEPVSLQARVEPEWWLTHNNLTYLRLTFLLPNSISPTDALGGADRRQLAFCFRTIKFDIAASSEASVDRHA